MEDGTYKGYFTHTMLVRVEKITPWGVEDVTKELTSEQIDQLSGVFLFSAIKNDGSSKCIVVEGGVPRMLSI